METRIHSKVRDCMFGLKDYSKEEINSMTISCRTLVEVRHSVFEDTINEIKKKKLNNFMNHLVGCCKANTGNSTGKLIDFLLEPIDFESNNGICSSRLSDLDIDPWKVAEGLCKSGLQ